MTGSGRGEDGDDDGGDGGDDGDSGDGGGDHPHRHLHLVDEHTGEYADKDPNDGETKHRTKARVDRSVDHLAVGGGSEHKPDDDDDCKYNDDDGNG